MSRRISLWTFAIWWWVMCLELFLCLNYPRMCDTPTLGLYCTRTGRYAYIARAFLVPAQESTHTLQGPFLYPHRKVRINYRELAAVTLACYWLNRALAYHIPAMRKVAVRTRLYRNTQCGIHKFGMRKSVSQVGNWFKSRR